MTAFSTMTADQHIAAAERHLAAAMQTKGNDNFVRPKLSMALMALSLLDKPMAAPAVQVAPPGGGERGLPRGDW